MTLEHEEAPGEALHNERVARFAMLAADNPDLAYEEYGLSLIHSIHEADAALYLKRIGYDVETDDTALLLAVAAHRRGDLEGAEKAYEDLLKKDKTRGEALYNLAVLKYQRGDEAGAKEALDKFLAFLSERPRTPYQKKALAFATALKEELEGGEDEEIES